MTRRMFLKAMSSGLAVCGPVSQTNHSVSEMDRTLRLARRIDNASKCVLSPDARFAVTFSGSGVHRFRLFDRSSPGLPDQRNGCQFSVHDLASNTVAWDGILPTDQPPILSSFFSDSRRLYAQVPNYKTQEDTLFIIDLNTKAVTRLNPIPTRPGYLQPLHAVSGDCLIGTDFNMLTRRNEQWLRVSIPDWKVQTQVPYKISQGDKSPVSTSSEVLSADCSTILHADGQIVICRSTKDLKVIWARTVDSMFPPSSFAISADGSWAAVGYDGDAFSRPQPRPYVAILNGRNGATISNVGLERVYQIGISPDGRLLAAGQRYERSKTEWDLTVKLYEIKSTSLISELQHANIRGRDRSIEAGFTINGIQFTSDGKYLSVAGRDTTLWRI